MKKIYFSFLYLGIYSFINAQPIITQANYPGVWESYPAKAHFAAPWTPGSSGPDQSWDFSGMTTGLTNLTFSYMWASETNDPHKTTFATSDLALELSLLPGQYSFFLNSSTEVEISGTVTSLPTEIVRPYSDPQKIVTFPFTYLNKFKDTARTGNYPYVNASSGADHQRRTIYSETEADAYGDFIAPNETVPAGTTYSNVLRIRITSKTIDSTFNSSNAFLFEDISIDTSYYWVSPEFKPHIFVLTKSVQDPEGTPATNVFAQYFTSPTAPTGNKDRYDSYFSIYPNPFSTELSIDVDENIFRLNPSLSISLHNSRGVEVMQQTMTSNKTVLSRKDLRSGIYFYKITSKNKVLSTGKLSIH